jgi:hypothetical protein
MTDEEREDLEALHALARATVAELFTYNQNPANNPLDLGYDLCLMEATRRRLAIEISE